MGILRLIYILISLCYVVHSPVMAQAFEDCKGDPSCESDYCIKYPTDPSCGSSTTFPDCGGDPDCNAYYTDSCEKDPKQDICKTATTTSSTSSGEFDACKGDTTCNETCTKNPSDPMCGSTSSTDSTSSTSESTGGFEACKGDPVCNETCTKNPSDPMCGSTSSTDSSTSTDSGTTPIMEITSPSEDTYTYDPNVFNPPSTIDECKGDTMCEKDYCVSNPSDPSCGSYYPSTESGTGSLYDSSLLDSGSLYDSSIIDSGSLYDGSIIDPGSLYDALPDLSSLADGTSTGPTTGTGSFIGSESAFYISPGQDTDSEISLESIYGPLSQDIKTGEKAVHRSSTNIYYYKEHVNDLEGSYPNALNYLNGLENDAMSLNFGSDEYYDTSDGSDSAETPPTISLPLVPCEAIPEYTGNVVTCWFHRSNMEDVNTDDPEIKWPNYSAELYKEPKNLNQPTNIFHLSYLNTVEPSGKGRVSNRNFRTRERLFKFGHRLDQTNLTEESIISETKSEQVQRLLSQKNNTAGKAWMSKTGNDNVLYMLEDQITVLKERLSVIDEILDDFSQEGGDFQIIFYQLAVHYDQGNRSDLASPLGLLEFLQKKDLALDNEYRINTSKEFVADKLLQFKKLLRLKAEIESEIDILKEEYNRVSRRFRYDLLYEY